MKVSDLIQALEGVPLDTEIMVNVQGTECRPAKVFAQMAIAPSGSKAVVSGWAFVVDLEGEEHQIEGKNLTYKLDASRNMPVRNPDGRFADL
jgi:hypothetical protein